MNKNSVLTIRLDENLKKKFKETCCIGDTISRP